MFHRVSAIQKTNWVRNTNFYRFPAFDLFFLFFLGGGGVLVIVFVFIPLIKILLVSGTI